MKKKANLTTKLLTLLEKNPKKSYTCSELAKRFKVNTGAVGTVVSNLNEKRGYKKYTKRVVFKSAA